MIIDLRTTAGFDQSDVAAALGVHPDTVRRWETGEIAVKVANAIALAQIFTATPQQFSRMTTLAQQGKQRGAVERFKGGAAPEFSLYADFEPTAQQIWCYEPEYLPGLVQTPAYLSATHAAQLPGQVENPDAVHKLRAARSQLFERDHVPELRFLIGIAAMIYLNELDDDSRAEQINHLLRVDALPQVEIRVISVMHAGMAGGFTLLTPEAGVYAANRFAYFESERVVRYDETPDVVSHHDQIFRSAWGRAHSIKEYPNGW